MKHFFHSAICGLVFILMMTQSSFAATSNLIYDYTTPYTGASQIILTNNGATAITISQLKFTTNAVITDKPWGTLWGWQSLLTNQANPDHLHVDYTVTENPTIKINPGASVSLTYKSDKVTGPFNPHNAAMPALQISVQTTEGATITPNIAGLCSGNACKDPGHGKRIMGYFINWAYWRNPKFTADQLPFDKINTVAYAFAIFDKNGQISLYDQESDAMNIPLLAKARQRYPYLNASLSFGGWSWASTPAGWQCTVGASPQGPAFCFSQMAKNSNAVNTFVSNAVAAMKEVNFNGIDIDWEYPTTAEDVTDYILLLQKLRSALDAQGQIDKTHYYLTIATPAGLDKIKNFTSSQLKTIAATVDFVDVMTYDFHGGWDQGATGTDFMSAMALDPVNDPTTKLPNDLPHYNVIDAITAYLGSSSTPIIPANKIVLGIPLYGRMMTIASAGTSYGLYQTIVGVPQGEWDNQQSGNTGMVDYHCIVDSTTCGNNYILPSLTLVDPTQNPYGKFSHTPWGYSANLFITYDDKNSTIYKVQWLKQQGLAGVMLWDLTGDLADNDPRSLVKAIYDTLSP